VELVRLGLVAVRLEVDESPDTDAVPPFARLPKRVAVPP
jgi:hypothetical protein